MKELTTASGKTFPFVGLGTFPLQGQRMTDIIKEAIKIGYRLFDTSDDYRGEAGIGKAIKEMNSSDICKREDLFLQTKISANASFDDDPLMGLFFNKYSSFMKRHSVEEIVFEKVENSLRLLNTDYIDSLLIHLPYSDYYAQIWEAMIKLQKQGKIRYLGVSNFHERHIETISLSGVVPTINEIYISPIGTKQEQVDYNQSRDILLMTYSPLMDLAKNRIPLERILPLVEKYHKTPSQIILRWNIERGCLPLPKTSKVERLVENFNIFDFTLTDEDVKSISSLNSNYQYLPESKICPGI